MSEVDVETLAELERTRALLRSVLESLLDDGWRFNRDSSIAEWWSEDSRRFTVES